MTAISARDGSKIRNQTSFRRGLSLLDTFRPGERKLSLTQMARRADLPKSTTHRLITDLISWGGLERADDGLLRLGMRLFELGRAAPIQRDLADVARPFLDDLHNITRKTVNLAVAHGLEIVYVDKIEAPDAPTVSRSGDRYPIHCTALGKAILAFSPPGLSDEVMRQGMTPRTNHSITSVALFRRELASVRSTRLSLDREELVPGLFCIGTPIFNSENRLLGAISVSSLESMSGARNLGPALLTISRAMSRELGPYHGAATV